MDPSSYLGHKCVFGVANSLSAFIRSEVARVLHVHGGCWLGPSIIDIGNGLIDKHPHSSGLPAPPQQPSKKYIAITNFSKVPDRPIPEKCFGGITTPLETRAAFFRCIRQLPQLKCAQKQNSVYGAPVKAIWKYNRDALPS